MYSRYASIFLAKTTPPYSLAMSLLKKPSVTQDQNMWVTENSGIHIEGSEKSAYYIDWAAESMWQTISSFSTHRFLVKNFPQNKCYASE
jgi:hypothetical protein